MPGANSWQSNREQNHNHTLNYSLLKLLLPHPLGKNQVSFTQSRWHLTGLGKATLATSRRMRGTPLLLRAYPPIFNGSLMVLWSPPAALLGHFHISHNVTLRKLVSQMANWWSGRIPTLACLTSHCNLFLGVPVSFPCEETL